MWWNWKGYIPVISFLPLYRTAPISLCSNNPEPNVGAECLMHDRLEIIQQVESSIFQ